MQDLAEMDVSEAVISVQVSSACNAVHFERQLAHRRACLGGTSTRQMADDVAAQEFFGDFIALDGHHFSVPVARPACLLQPLNWDVASCSEGVDRMTEGLAALALSLRRRFTIRCGRRGRRSPP